MEKRDGFSSGKKIHPDAWDEKSALAGMNCPDYKLINSYVAKTRVELEKHYNQLAGINKKITATMVKEAYMPKEIILKTLIQAFKLHNDEFAERVGKNKGSKGVYYGDVDHLRAKLTQGLADFWVAANAIKACTKIVI